MSIEILVRRLICNHCGKVKDNFDVECLDDFIDHWHVDIDNDYAECPECAAKLKALAEGM